MRRADGMTVEEMAEALGYTRDADGDWLDGGGIVAGTWRDGGWVSWPEGRSYAHQCQHPTEHAAMERLYYLRFPEADEPDPEPAAKAPPRSSAVAYAQGSGGGGGAQTPVRATTVKIPDGATTAAIALGPSGASIAFGFAAPAQSPTPDPIVEPGADTARESATLEAEPEGARERWRFTVALAVVVDGRACIEFQRRITESALVALLTPRADRWDVLALARDCDDMERHCAYDRRTGRPFAFVERVA